MTQDNPKQEFSPEQRFQIGPQNSQGSPEQVKQFAKQAPEAEREFVKVDLQTTRPYFLIPFLDQDDIRVDDPSAPVPVAALDLVRATKRLKEYLAKSGPITDVYVVSHGWHRNLYSATAAYDRIISRFATLRRRGRIKTGEPFNPLFLTLHWHSDLGENGWVDHLGRRDRDSFLRLVFERLKPRKDGVSSGTMRNTFEDLFELFVKMSSPNIGALAPGIQDDARDFSSTFTEYTIRDAEDATPDEVIAAAWSCYHEAEVAKPVVEQQERPRPFSSVSSYLTKLVQIVVGVAGIGTVLGLIFQEPNARRHLGVGSRQGGNRRLDHPWLSKLEHRGKAHAVVGLGVPPSVDGCRRWDQARQSALGKLSHPLPIDSRPAFHGGMADPAGRPFDTDPLVLFAVADLVCPGCRLGDVGGLRRASVPLSPPVVLGRNHHSAHLPGL